MSNYLAIATVTAALRDILQNAALAAVPGADVTLKRPERASSDGQEKAAINLYLYHVAPNPTWSNIDLPTRSENGTLRQRPQVALNLDYLLSFYGSELVMEPQRLLGSAAVALHEWPILMPDAIRSAIDNNSYLAPSDLSTQTERVKFEPLNFNLEELSKLWSIFFQVPYTLSVAYRATAVLLEAQVDIQTAKQVLERGITVEPEVSR
jgi:hypothetical protein